MNRTRRLRLLKVIVQPVFVVDDGENLTEQVAEPVAVSPEEWPTFASARFLDGMEALEARLNDGSYEPSNGPPV